MPVERLIDHYGATLKDSPHVPAGPVPVERLIDHYGATLNDSLPRPRRPRAGGTPD